MEKQRCSSLAIFRLQRAYDSVMVKELHNNVTECVINMKLIVLTKMWLNETYNRVWVGKHVYVVFPVMDGMKKDVLLPLLFKFILEQVLSGSRWTRM